MRFLFGLIFVCLTGLSLAQDVSRDALPAEAREVLSLIRAGGPFPHRRDGVVFNNFEKHLPTAPRGYYREYTVPTPGIKHRGARRIVCGGFEPRRPDVCYYSSDHYHSFARIVE